MDAFNAMLKESGKAETKALNESEDKYNAAMKARKDFALSTLELSADAAEAIAETLLIRKRSIGIFPSGTTCITEDVPWRHGAFKLAEKHQIPVQPFRIKYEPLRKLAYIEKDTFATHLLALLRLERVKATIEFDEVRMITDHQAECVAIRDWTRELFADYKAPHEK
jgi:1-acyl-sn-glycerol-3-phosphate acyltransferase